jgi:hypothetical protein
MSQRRVGYIEAGRLYEVVSVVGPICRGGRCWDAFVRRRAQQVEVSDAVPPTDVMPLARLALERAGVSPFSSWRLVPVLGRVAY